MTSQLNPCSMLSIASWGCRHMRRLTDARRSIAVSATQAAHGLVALLLVCCIIPLGVGDIYAQDAPPRPEYRQLSYYQVDQLVAPIALYPDDLVAQILTAATYSPQVVEADRFVRRNTGVPPDELARMSNSQPWDPSVKALTAFPSALSQLDRNLDWTVKLGNAYYNQPQDVMNAVQTMRRRAYAVGTLRSTQQQTVVYQPADIIIQPANPAVVYVPVYNPWVVYGAPVPVYPAYYYVAPPPQPAGSVAVAAAVGFTTGVVVGSFVHYGWGWGHWGCGWGPRPFIAYNHVTYVSRSVTVVNHGYYGGYDHSWEARSYNRQVVYGPHGNDATRTVTRGGGQTDVTVTGSHGRTYTRDTTHYAGGDTTTVTGPGGRTATRTVNGRGTGDVSATTTLRNGKTVSRSTSRYPGGSSTTVTGPNGKTGTRTVTGRGTGDATITCSGPRGTRTRTRHGRY
jgi:hypothetical protein